VPKVPPTNSDVPSVVRDVTALLVVALKLRSAMPVLAENTARFLAAYETPEGSMTLSKYPPT